MPQPINIERPQCNWSRAQTVIGRGCRLTLASALVLCLTMVVLTAGPVEVSAEESPAAAFLGGTGPLTGAIFETGDDPDYQYVNDVLATLTQAQAQTQTQTQARIAEQQQTMHWDPAQTALNNGGALQGDALELTWSIIPDGTLVVGQVGEPDCNSTLVASLDAAYGAGNWQAEMQKVWADWTRLTGNVYTPAVPLDANGTPIEATPAATWGLFPSTPGLASVRGDIRIGGCFIDGASGTNTLAYNFFPNNGDMKIDTDNLAGLALTTDFHNVFSHEHGHGAGLSHVCPVNQTKLMEPFLSTAFIGLQHDDIRAVQRGYGDRFETISAPNDTLGAATTLDPLTPPDGQTELQLSLDSTNDEDWFQFSGTAGDIVDVLVAPNGLTYPEGPLQGESCGTSTPLNSLALQDLSFEIRNTGGALSVVDATNAGNSESLTGFVIPTTGTYYVRVLGTGTDDTQLYDLTVNQTASPTPPPAPPATPASTPATTPASTPASTPPTTVTPPNVTPVDPGRIYESRSSNPAYVTVDGQSQGGGRTLAGGITEIKVTGRANVATDAEAVFLNVAAVSPSGPGFLTVFPCGTTRPNAANINYVGGGVAANAVLAKIGDSGKICVFTLAETDLVIDINGYIPGS